MGVSRSATRKWKMFFNIIKMSIIKCAAHTSKLKFKFTSVLKSSWRRLGTDPLTPLLKENFLTFVNHTLLGGDYIVNFNLVWNFSLVSQAEISACGSERNPLENEGGHYLEKISVQAENPSLVSETRLQFSTWANRLKNPEKVTCSSWLKFQPSLIFAM